MECLSLLLGRDFLHDLWLSARARCLDIHPGDGVQANGGSTGLNHQVFGATTVTNNVWHHAAATYDGTTWKLYLDGVLDGSLTVGQPPRSDSVQHAALGTAMTSTGAAAGFFQGA